MRVVSDDAEARGDPEAPRTLLRTGRLSDQSEPAYTDRPHTAHNAKAWDALAREGVALAQPARDEELRDPLATVDPVGWLGGDIRGWRVLCLAAGGGRHSALYAAAGAMVTVVDISGEMLALDRAVAAERGFEVRLVQTAMDELSMFAPEEFDLVIHPVSTCYVPDVGPVFSAVARVTRGGGLYVSQHKSPVSLQTSLRPDRSRLSAGYTIDEPYYRTGPLPPAEPGRLRERGTLEFLHRWEQLLGGMCRAGFAIEDLLEPLHAKPQAAVGSFDHRAQYVAPYVRIKARRSTSTAISPDKRLVLGV
jgi:SAM-dependent methyltransferase